MEKESPLVRTGENVLANNTVQWRILSMLVDRWIMEVLEILLAIFFGLSFFPLFWYIFSKKGRKDPCSDWSGSNSSVAIRYLGHFLDITISLESVCRNGG